MNKRTPEGEALTSVILEIFRLNGEMLDAGNKLTKPLGLTSARWQVMGVIDLAEQPMTVAQIARRMGLSRQGVQRVVNDLVELDMLLFESNIDHKRAPLISISDSGKKVISAIGKAQIAWVDELAKGLSERKLTQTLHLLEEIRQRSEERKKERNVLKK